MANEERAIAIGDVVRLKSGGPAMTVVAVGRGVAGETLCAWMNAHGDQAWEAKSSAFPPASLEKAPPGTY